MSKFTIKLAYTRHMEFEVDAETAYEAASEAQSAFEYSDRTPSDDWCDAVELEGVKFGDREFEIDTRFDFNAAKDDRGMTPVITVARDANTMRKLDEDRDAEALLNRLFSEPDETPAATS